MNAQAATAGRTAEIDAADSGYAWFRLGIALLLMTVGGCCMYAIAVVLPAVQAEFGSSRSEASLPYTALMIGFGVGGVLMGRLADRFGVMYPLILGSIVLGLGCVAAASAASLLQFGIVHGILIGLLGSSCTFGPLVTDVSFWFRRKRGIAVAICASGNYLAGAIWPPIVQHFTETIGWRQTYFALGIFCTATMLPLALLLRRRPSAQMLQGGPAPLADPARAGEPGSSAVAAAAMAAAVEPASASAGVAAQAVGAASAPAGSSASARLPRPSALDANSPRPLGLSRNGLFLLLNVAGIACCVAMAMPQVHIVAYCGDLGFGPAHGAQMLSLMLGFGIISRITSGLICDRIGGVRTLLLGSALQGLALLLFLPFDALWSLFLVSALFGLSQGGIVPSYTIIVREYFPANEAGARVGMVLMATLVGMALGGWMSGMVFDLTGSYHAAFLNGIGWNLLNGSIALFLLSRQRRILRARWPGPQLAGA